MSCSSRRRGRGDGKTTLLGHGARAQPLCPEPVSCLAFVSLLVRGDGRLEACQASRAALVARCRRWHVGATWLAEPTEVALAGREPPARGGHVLRLRSAWEQPGSTRALQQPCVC